MTAVTGGLERPTKIDLLTGYRQLASVLGVVLGERGIDEVLARISETLRGLVPCEDVVIWERVGSELQAMFVQGDDAEAIRRLRIQFGTGFTGLAAETREPVWSNDAHLDPRAQQVPGTSLVPEAMICVPLLVREELIGVLSIYRTGEKRAFEEAGYELTLHFAEVAAIAIDNARTRAELEHLATTDDLTGVANRRRFRQELARELAASKRYGRDVSLLLLDLDGFKGVNDTFGHDRGDEVLRTVADLLTGHTRENDLVARMGGDEFAVLLPETPPERADELARRLCDAIATRVGGFGIRASIGAASHPQTSTHELLIEADRRLYATRRGRLPSTGRALIFSAAGRAAAHEDLQEEGAGRPPEGVDGHRARPG
jgi:diguanylate cyclase (GGDEF)-like protein